MNLPEIHWSDHAVARFHERFGDGLDVKFPDGMLQYLGMRKETGEQFRFKQGEIVFVCRRNFDSVVVVTVFKEKQNGVHEGARDNGGVGAAKGRRSHRRRVVSNRSRTAVRDKRIAIED